MPLPPVRVVNFTPPTGRPWGSNVKNTEIKYLSDIYNDNDDIISRWGLILKKINTAESILNRSYPSDPPNTLKVFVGPEWLFRKKNIKESDEQIIANPEIVPKYNPPYTQKDVIALITQILKDSRTAPYNSWMIVPGTIYWGKKGAKGKWDTFNVAPVAYNGRLISLVHKQLEADLWESHENWGNGTLNENPITKLSNAVRNSKKIIDKLKLGYQVDSAGLFECQRVRFGLEICGDHSTSAGRLFPQKLESLKPLILPFGGSIDESGIIHGITNNDDLYAQVENSFQHIHILVSCGAGPLTQKNVAIRRGYFIHSDGSGYNLEENSKCPKLIEVSSIGKTHTSKITFSFNYAYNIKNYSPNGSTNVYQRFAIFSHLINLNPTPINTSLTDAVSTS